MSSTSRNSKLLQNSTKASVITASFQLLTARQTAARLAITTATLYRMVKKGVIRQHRIGPRGPCRFRLEDVERALIPNDTPDQTADDLKSFVINNTKKKV